MCEYIEWRARNFKLDFFYWCVYIVMKLHLGLDATDANRAIHASSSTTLAKPFGSTV